MTDQDALPTFTATLPLIRWILIRENIEIVHAHQATSTMANESLVYAAALGLASIYTDHSLFGFDDLAGVILNRVLQTTLSTVDAAICVSHTCRDNLVLRAHLTRPSLVHVIPNAVDPTKFTPVPHPASTMNALRSKESADGRIRVVVISRLVYRKGVDLLAATIPLVCRHMDNVDFLVGGDGTKLLQLQEMVERERLEDRVEFLGAVPHAQVRDVLVRGHVFLNCSLTESFCIAILEASCCGLLVVSTNVGGVPEVLPSDLILLSDPNVPSLVETVKRAIERQQVSPLNPWTTHKRVSEMYSWRRVAKETELVYKTVLCAPRRSFVERLACYNSLGGIAGYVACVLAATLQMLVHLVVWWQPDATIDVVPDIPRVSASAMEHLDGVSL